MKIKLTVKGKRLTLDFSECDPQVKTAFNLVTNGQKHPFLYQGLINYIISQDPFIPINGGITYPIEVISQRDASASRIPGFCWYSIRLR
ncbi:hydantoinase B/oxoprolinase family protein [Bacillus sp. SL00103]